jgi:hypothetical protein
MELTSTYIPPENIPQGPKHVVGIKEHSKNTVAIDGAPKKIVIIEVA